MLGQRWIEGKSPEKKPWEAVRQRAQAAVSRLAQLAGQLLPGPPGFRDPPSWPGPVQPFQKTVERRRRGVGLGTAAGFRGVGFVRGFLAA
jgi:hypothetical protein